METVNPSEPAIFLFSTAEPPGAGAWLLISFIPDVAKVREKMLYSSCREDLKRSLGASMFKAEYAANEPSELTWAAMNAYFNSAKSDLFLTEREKLVMEEKARIDAETVFTKTSMMAALPFAVDPALTAKLGELATVAAEGAVGNWLEVSFAKETLQLAATEHVGEEVTSWATFVRSEEPRFYVFSLRKPGGGDSGDRLNFLAFFCPEATPVRTKMAMSRCAFGPPGSASCQRRVPPPPDTPTPTAPRPRSSQRRKRRASSSARRLKCKRCTSPHTLNSLSVHALAPPVPSPPHPTPSTPAANARSPTSFALSTLTR